MRTIPDRRAYTDFSKPSGKNFQTIIFHGSLAIRLRHGREGTTTCTYMHIHTHTCTYIHIHAHTCTYMHIHAHTYTYMQIHAHTCTYTQKKTIVLLCVHTYMHVFSHVVRCIVCACIHACHIIFAPIGAAPCLVAALELMPHSAKRNSSHSQNKRHIE